MRRNNQAPKSSPPRNPQRQHQPAPRSLTSNTHPEKLDSRTKTTIGSKGLGLVRSVRRRSIMALRSRNHPKLRRTQHKNLPTTRLTRPRLATSLRRDEDKESRHQSTRRQRKHRRSNTLTTHNRRVSIPTEAALALSDSPELAMRKTLPTQPILRKCECRLCPITRSDLDPAR